MLDGGYCNLSIIIGFLFILFNHECYFCENEFLCSLGSLQLFSPANKEYTTGSSWFSTYFYARLVCLGVVRWVANENKDLSIPVDLWQELLSNG